MAEDQRAIALAEICSLSGDGRTGGRARPLADPGDRTKRQPRERRHNVAVSNDEGGRGTDRTRRGIRSYPASGIVGVTYYSVSGASKSNYSPCSMEKSVTSAVRIFAEHDRLRMARHCIWRISVFNDDDLFVRGEPGEMRRELLIEVSPGEINFVALRRTIRQ